MDRFGRFPTTFLTSCLFSCAIIPFWKGSTLKGKNLLPWGANSSLLEQTPFKQELSEDNAARQMHIFDNLNTVLTPKRCANADADANDWVTT